MKFPLCATIFSIVIASTVPVLAAGEHSQAPVAGSAPVGVNITENQSIMKGWSAKHTIIGKAVYNDQNERIGTVDDVIISPDKKATYGIIGVGGFLSMGTHDVAVPTSQIRMDRDRIVLPGATKEALKRMPEFHYAKK